MLLNLFFENMNSKLELVLIGAFFLALYWFVLRKYNSLGLRLFVVCFFLFIALCVWIHQDEVSLKNTLNNGEKHIATIISKTKVDKNDNQVEVSFTSNDGKTINSKTTDYISQDEWNTFETGKPLSIIYDSKTSETFVQQSLMRFKNDKIFLYYFAGFLLVLGICLYIWLRKFKIGVDDNGNEWVIKKDGSVILDERKSAAARATKKVNIFSKLIRSFGK